MSLPTSHAETHQNASLPTTKFVISWNELQTATVHLSTLTTSIEQHQEWHSLLDLPDCQLKLIVLTSNIHAYLSQSSRLSKKLSNMKGTKHYLNCCTIVRDGMLVVPHHKAFSPTTEWIIVSRHALVGLLTALHNRLDHITQFHLKQVFCHYFYAVKLDSILSRLNNNCHIFVSLKKIPTPVPPAVTSNPLFAPGCSFAIYILRWHGSSAETQAGILEIRPGQDPPSSPHFYWYWKGKECQ